MTLETEANYEPKILPAKAKCEPKISKKPKILPLEAKCPNCDLESFKSIFEFNKHIKKCFEKQPVKGGFQLLDLIITELKSHMTC